MRKRAEPADATKARIPDAAVRLFGDRFPPEVTLREVASSAGVALQTVVNHFGSKEGLVAAVIEGAGRDGAFAEHRVCQRGASAAWSWRRLDRPQCSSV